MVLAGCGRSEPPGRVESPVEAQIRHSLAAQLAPIGVDVQAVECAPPRCTATLAGGATINLTTTAAGASGAVDWTLDGLVVAAAPLEDYVRHELDDLGVTARIDCGPRARAAHVGDRLRCVIAPPIGGLAWATIRDPSGAVAVEIALGDEAAQARTVETDQAALEQMSLALGGRADDAGAADDGDGEGDDGAGVGDAGVGDAGARDAGRGDTGAGQPGGRDAGLAPDGHR